MAALLRNMVKITNKGQIHYLFIGIVSLILFWNICSGFEKWFYDNKWENIIFVNLIYISVCFVPVVVLLLGIVFKVSSIKFNFKYFLLFIIPTVSIILFWTNEYHHLFYISYSFWITNMTFGKYFIIHAIYSYTCIFVGISFLIYSAFKISGFFSRQMMFILLGFSLPLITNLLYTIKVITVTQDVNALTFSFTTVCFYIAIFKYDFLRVMPIALQIVVDRISNGFIVVDLDLRVVNFNKTMTEIFRNIASLKTKENIFKLCESIIIDIELFKKYINTAHETNKPIEVEKQFKIKDKLEGFFTIEITPLIYKNKHLGTVIMFTDITQQKEDLKIIKKQQEQITEKERLASLGTLMGGISHNLKTPIMSITGCITALEELTNEYSESIGNTIVNDNDHLAIANDMKVNIYDLKEHISYINNALTAIKNQVVNPEARDNSSFSLEELVININFLMKYELKSNRCSLEIINEAEKDYYINGDIGTLVQILNNLISNSIQAYDKISETVELKDQDRKIIFRISNEDNQIIFMVRDYGKGIPQHIKNKLFKEMVTSKGKEGHGIGLYLSYSKVKLMFNGDMWLGSEEGEGTSFFVKIHSTKIDLVEG